MTQVDIRLDQLGQIPLFSGLTNPELGQLIQAAHVQQQAAGEFFFFQGDPAERMYVLTSGRVKLSQVGQGGEQVLIHMIIPLHLFALVAMTATEQYPVSAQAAEDSQALRWSRQELMGFVQSIPRLAMNAMKLIAEQVSELQERFREATTELVEQRLARMLLRLAAQSGRKVNEGILIDFQFSRQDLAEMAGTTLYTASRVLNQWEDEGLVLLGRERVVLRYPHGLVKIAGR